MGRLTKLSDDSRSKGMHDDQERMKHVFEDLEKLCSTQVAKNSLKKFKIEYEVMLSRGKEGRDKKGVFGRLMGRRRGAEK